MRSLFFKIFVWFWLAMTAVGTALVVSTETTSNERDLRRFMISRPMTMYAHTAARIFEHEGAPGLCDYLTSVNKVANLGVFMFDEQGKELCGKEPSAQIKDLAGQANLKKDLEPIFPGNTSHVAQSVRTPSGHRYVLVAEIESHRAGRPGPRTPFRWTRFLGIGNTATSTLLFRLLTVLITSGIVCYGLARYLTAPLVRLRSATHRLANGDLKARFGRFRGGRQDELTDLGQDFDLMAERIESMVSAQRRLLTDISHELRSPLARINLAVGLIRQRQEEESGVELARIDLESKRLDSLIGQLLKLAKLENGAAEYDKKPIALAPFLQEIAEDSDFEAKSRNRVVRVTKSEGLTLLGNAELLRSAIENVVRNALYYTRESTTVEISLEHQRKGHDSNALIRVLDHGDGVPDSVLVDLFRPFYRVADARDRQSGGVGLGLAIAEHAIRWHGGTIKASNMPNNGLLVEIQLPVVSVISAPEPTSSTPGV